MGHFRRHQARRTAREPVSKLLRTYPPVPKTFMNELAEMLVGAPWQMRPLIAMTLPFGFETQQRTRALAPRRGRGWCVSPLLRSTSSKTRLTLQGNDARRASTSADAEMPLPWLRGRSQTAREYSAFAAQAQPEPLATDRPIGTAGRVRTFDSACLDCHAPG
jgi:hypothetical protein